MSTWRRDVLAARMLVCSDMIKNLLMKISALEGDKELSTDEKLSQIKIVKEEITKVGTEIDNIKKEIKLLDTYSLN